MSHKNLRTFFDMGVHLGVPGHYLLVELFGIAKICTARGPRED